MSAPSWKPGDVVTLDATKHWIGLDRGRAAARVAAFLREIEAKWGTGDIRYLTAKNGGSGCLRWLAEEFEAVSRDPKPEEPQGLGAVVEDADGARWIRVWGQGIGGAWQGAELPDGPDVQRNYANIAAVRVLSEGWRA